MNENQIGKIEQLTSNSLGESVTKTLSRVETNTVKLTEENKKLKKAITKFLQVTTDGSFRCTDEGVCIICSYGDEEESVDDYSHYTDCPAKPLREILE